MAALAQCRFLLAVIGPDWTERIRNRNNYVRIEVLEAHRRGLRIIPVLLAEVPRPTDASMPADLQYLQFPRLQTSSLRRDPDFDADYSKLAGNIRKLAAQGEQNSDAVASKNTDQPRRAIRDRFPDGRLGPGMIVIPENSREVSCVDSAGRSKKGLVTIPEFAMSRFTVTFSEFDTFANAAGLAAPPDNGWGRGRRPVINVNWHTATAFAAWLSAQTGELYRLPSETEWECAASAGAHSKYSTGDEIDTEHANYDGRRGRAAAKPGVFRRRTVEVGSFPPNAWGLCDMHGNVAEWTAARCYPRAVETRRRSEPTRVAKGGSWHHTARHLEMTSRLCYVASYHDNSVGFRLVRRT